MPYHEIVFQVYEFVFLLGVLTITALLIFAGFVSVLVDLAINRLLKKPSSKTSQVKVDRRLTTQRPSPTKPAKTVRPMKLKGSQIKAMVDKCKSSDCERLAKIRSMAADADRILIRMKRARAQRQALKEAEETRIKQQAQEMAQTVQSSWQTCRRLNALMRERTRKNEIWLRQIRDRTKVPQKLIQDWKPELKSSGKADDKEASSATKTPDKNKADLRASEGCGIKSKEVSVTPADGYHMDDDKDKQVNETTDSASDHRETKREHANINPVRKVRGDTKVIKMKLGKNNKLANLLDPCPSGDGFYVYL